MRHQNKGRKLSRNGAHRSALLKNLVTSLFKHESIETTSAKAKELRGVAERLISTAKKSDLHARRLVNQTVRDKDVLKKLFDQIAPRFLTRAGGYTRVLNSGFRRGDNAPMSIIQLTDRSEKVQNSKGA